MQKRYKFKTSAFLFSPMNMVTYIMMVLKLFGFISIGWKFVFIPTIIAIFITCILNFFGAINHE